jgi:hypothetical protein
VRVSLDRTAKGDALVLHLVNYAREEGAPNRGKGIADERPLAVKGVEVELMLPEKWRPGPIAHLTPEGEPRELPPIMRAGRMVLQVPEFLVYGIIKIEVQR